MTNKKDRINFEATWEILKHTQNLIEFADKKTIVLLLISGALTSFTFLKVDTLLEIIACTKFGSILLVFMTLFILIFLVFMVYCLLTIIPNLLEETPSELSRVIYFNHVLSHKSPDNYLKRISNLSEDEFLKDITFQIYNMSKIARKKMNYAKISAWLLSAQFLTFLILYVSITIYNLN